MNDAETIAALVAACHEVAACGLLQCSSGNMSVRLADGRLAISASRSWLGQLTAAQLSVCRIADGEVLNGVRPSVETVFHRGILEARPELTVVLHFQSPCATAIACADPRAFNYAVIPEIPYYIGEPGFVEYLTPGSPELAAAVIAEARTHDLVFMRNHGLLTVGQNFAGTIQRAVFFELACSILLRGLPVQPLSPEACAHLRGARGA